MPDCRRLGWRRPAAARLQGGLRSSRPRARAPVCALAVAVCASAAAVAGAPRAVDPDAMGAAFAEGAITLDSFARAYHADKVEQLEEVVASGWKQQQAGALGGGQRPRPPGRAYGASERMRRRWTGWGVEGRPGSRTPDARQNTSRSRIFL